MEGLQHGRCKHRTWHKVHIAVDPRTRQIVATETTVNNHDDTSVIPEFLTQIYDIIDSLYDDGADDKRAYTRQPPNTKFTHNWGLDYEFSSTVK